MCNEYPALRKWRVSYNYIYTKYEGFCIIEDEVLYTIAVYKFYIIANEIVIHHTYFWRDSKTWSTPYRIGEFCNKDKNLCKYMKRENRVHFCESSRTFVTVTHTKPYECVRGKSIHSTVEQIPLQNLLMKLFRYLRRSQQFNIVIIIRCIISIWLSSSLSYLNFYILGIFSNIN